MKLYTLPLVVALGLALPAAAETDSDLERAKALSEEGRAAYDRDDFAGAAEKFQAAYELFPNPVLLVNLGVIYQALHRYEEAREALDAFLSNASPDDPLRREAEKTRKSLDKEAKKYAAALAREGMALYKEARKKAATAAARELLRGACAKYQEAYDASKVPGYQLSAATCLGAMEDWSGAEWAYRVFLMVAPADHKDRLAAEQAREHATAQREAAERARPQEVVFSGSLPALTLSPEAEKRLSKRAMKMLRLALLGGAALAAGATGGVFFLTREPGNPQVNGAFEPR